MSLSDLKIKDDYRSDIDSLVDDFYLPCLAESHIYNRAVGFFSSSSLVAVAKGLTALIRSGGKMQLIASPCLTEEDLKAITRGIEKQEIITQSLIRELDKDFAQLAQDRLACLAWLLQEQILEIKIAISPLGMFHEKLGILQDLEGNLLAFTGSANETSSALIDNFECIDVFCSWKPAEEERTIKKEAYFQRLWQNQTDKVEIISFPEAAARSLLKFRPDYPPLQEARQKTTWKVKNAPGTYQSSYSLRPPQREAIAAYQQAQHRGILALATGVGKTLTAIYAAQKIPILNLIVVGVPSKDLVHQWVKELRQHTPYPNPIVAIGSSEQWREVLLRKLRLFHYLDVKQPIVLVGTYGELAKERVSTLIEDAGGLPTHSLLIADEVHNTGSKEHQKILWSNFAYRLGLSATPLRPYDEEGTQTVLDYFGGVVYEYNLAQAIAAGFLCPYDYHVYITSLSEDEYVSYQNLTTKIAALNQKDDSQSLQYRRQLLIRRSHILKSAHAKIATLPDICQNHSLKGAMIYCVDLDQATQVTASLQKTGISVARYSSLEKNRQELLTQLAAKELDALVAVKCLDEGVDIPSVQLAILLSSDSSERQFIQRRGRILRTAPNKKYATLIDVLVVPPDDTEQLIKSEINRVRHFAESARNRNSLIVDLQDRLSQYGLSYADLV